MLSAPNLLRGGWRLSIASVLTGVEGAKGWLKEGGEEDVAEVGTSGIFADCCRVGIKGTKELFTSLLTLLILFPG